jgi:hypothetical protein
MMRKRIACRLQGRLSCVQWLRVSHPSYEAYIVSKSSRPWLITELIGRGLKVIAGTLPLAKALRGKVSDDPRVEEEFFEDGERGQN